MFEVIRFFVKIVFCTFYRVKVMGYDKLPKTGPVLLISNHESMLDMFMIGYRIRRKVCWMAKAEIFEKKIPAKIFTWFKAYPIKRSGNDTGAINTTFSLLKSGEVVGIFPQGHRTRGQGNNLKAKYGAAKIAAETNTIIQPVAIWGTVKLFHRIYVKFGDPFYLELEKDHQYTKAEYTVICQSIMDKIYGMMEVKKLGNSEG